MKFSIVVASTCFRKKVGEHLLERLHAKRDLAFGLLDHVLVDTRRVTCFGSPGLGPAIVKGLTDESADRLGTTRPEVPNAFG